MEYHTRRVEKSRETNNTRIMSSTSDATEAVGESSQERARCISAREYGPPAFQIDDIATIIKDTSPGVHNATHIRMHMVTNKDTYEVCLHTITFYFGSDLYLVIDFI